MERYMRKMQMKKRSIGILVNERRGKMLEKGKYVGSDGDCALVVKRASERRKEERGKADHLGAHGMRPLASSSKA
jgi:hypothetical protein